ncbi:MAG: type II toxin-antitoxin system VapC family toxin [Methylobacillus sp.]|jgi:tRNA(fMet)-specific endonuclease VapC|nr:type II toxin-antitoxin system VapC family toxin [Methylobacillus sp.]
MRYLLDTNIASHLIRGDNARVVKRTARCSIGSVAVSAITEAELLYGLAKRGNPPGLAARISAFLARVEILPWTRAEATAYSHLRVMCEEKGISLDAMDMMIGAHARATGSILVSADKAFGKIPDGLLKLEDWTRAAS